MKKEEPLNDVSEFQNHGVIAVGGGGGGGGGGPGGGRGGDGGSVHVVNGIPPEKVTIHHVKNPHKEYFEMLFGSIWKWISSSIMKIVIEVAILVIGAIVLARLGLSK